MQLPNLSDNTPKPFERELMALLHKHKVTRFMAVFSDPDRHPWIINRFVHKQSGVRWAMDAGLQLAAKIKHMVEMGKLSAADDIEAKP